VSCCVGWLGTICYRFHNFERFVLEAFLYCVACWLVALRRCSSHDIGMPRRCRADLFGEEEVREPESEI
jgi:hypothetical protein